MLLRPGELSTYNNYDCLIIKFETYFKCHYEWYHGYNYNVLGLLLICTDESICHILLKFSAFTVVSYYFIYVMWMRSIIPGCSAHFDKADSASTPNYEDDNVKRAVDTIKNTSTAIVISFIGLTVVPAAFQKVFAWYIIINIM